MRLYRFEQYTDEWVKIRCGIPTASDADKILTPTGKLSAQADKYMDKLLAERAGFQDDPIEPTAWMLRGIELEPEARALFEFQTGWEVEQVGFATNDDGTAGCSPDGIIHIEGGREGWETKCPKASTHIGYLRAGILPPYYKPQVHFSLAVTGLNRWWFMSHYPGLEPLIVPVDRDEYTEKVAKAVRGFTDRLAEESEKLGLEIQEKAA